MFPSLTELLAEIKDGAIPLADIFSSADCDSLLELRDSDSSFDAMYRGFGERIDKVKFILNYDPTEAVWKEAFLAVSEATHQHHIASYVSDDFELIAWWALGVRLIDLKSPPPFVEWLYSEYKYAKFPCPPFPDGDCDSE